MRHVLASGVLLLTTLEVAVCAQDQMRLSSGSGSRSEVRRSVPVAYVLGADDQIGLLAADTEELNGKAFRIGMDGNVELPLVGTLHAAGLTTNQLATEVNGRLKKFLVAPHVVLTVVEFRSQPISVLGAVNAPGVHQLQGRKTLYEVLSLAGGLREDSGNTVKITRKLEWGRIPLSTAHDDPAGLYSIASVNIKSILDGNVPEDNIQIKPEDVISIPKAEVIYVVGSVHKPGGFPLGENTSLSALQLLSLAQGMESSAAPGQAKILRDVPGKPARLEIPVNLTKLLAGKCPDVQLRANDILFVPNSFAKSVAIRSLETALGMGAQIGAGLAIYK